jgi:D-glycero-alpha-D-manno-heptose-7-phosphate kinase
LIIRARAPLRIGLAGGGTDVSPYCNQFGGLVLNATIARYAYATIEVRSDQKIHFFSGDKNFRDAFGISDEITLEGPSLLLRATYLHMIKHYNGGRRIAVELTTFCDSPPGSGLGTSSTLVVAMVKAFSGYLELDLDNYTIAEVAYKIERIECQLMGGRQDQYSAAFGGFNFIEFAASNQVTVNNLSVSLKAIQELEASFILFFTGVSRDSDRIILDQSNNVKNKHKVAMEAMHLIKKEAQIMKSKLLDEDFQGIVESMINGWENKKKSADVISNPLIEEIYDCAVNSGALAGKVSGAGGGGFMIFFVPIEKRKSLIDSLSKFNGEISNVHFTNVGAQFWKTK